VVDPVALVSHAVAKPHAVENRIVIELVGPWKKRRQLRPVKANAGMTAGVKAVVSVKGRQLEGHFRGAIPRAGAAAVHTSLNSRQEGIDLLHAHAKASSLNQRMLSAGLIAVHVQLGGEFIEPSIHGKRKLRTISPAE
jgi:hypothetical protein